MDEADGSGHVFTVASGAVVHEGAAEVVEDVVGVEAAAIEALVDDGALLSGLGEKVAIEVGVAAAGGVGQIDVGELAVAELVDFAAVGLDPGEIAERGFAFERNNGDFTRAGGVGVGSDAQERGFAGGFFEEAVDLVGAANVAAVDGEKVFAFDDVDAGCVSGARSCGFQFSPS